jgi:hypothetical protein
LNFEQVDETLRRALPKLFQFLDSHTPQGTQTNSDGSKSDELEQLPPYVICVASGHNLDAAPQDFLTASDVLFMVGGAKSTVLFQP